MITYRTRQAGFYGARMNMGAEARPQSCFRSGGALLLLLLVLLEEGLPVIGAAAELAQAGLLTPGGSHVSSVHVELAGHTAGTF